MNPPKLNNYSNNRRMKLKIFAALTIVLLSSCSDMKVDNGNISVSISSEGNISSIKYNKTLFKTDSLAYISVDGYKVENVSTSKDNGVVTVEKTLTNKSTNQKATLKEVFTPTKHSVKWRAELIGDASACSAPIKTRFDLSSGDSLSFWTTWGRPQINLDNISDEELRHELKLMNNPSNDWLNALATIPFTDALYYYGAPYLTNENPEIAYCPIDMGFMHKKYNGAIISVPLAVVMDNKTGNGLTFASSLRDYIQDLTLETTKDGIITFARYNHRLVDTNPITFECDIVGHADDWRESLRWISEAYPEYFEPENPFSQKMGGTGAYTNFDVNFDIKKMKDMAFSVNWRASFDFPYMGMFLPPVRSKTEEWTRFGGAKSSVDLMANYSSKMKDAEFFVLNYFNITEFGSYVSQTEPPKTTKEGEEWKNADDYLYGKLSDAILTVPDNMNLKGCIYPKTTNGGHFYTWEDGVIMDCGVNSYSEFLMDQAKRHIEEIPDAYGFCIDRMDWTRMFNIKRDDGRSWYDNQPVSSMVLSWTEFMDKFSKLVHDNDKVIFVNNHTKRIDLLKHADGIFDEFTNGETPLNTTAFTTLKKPFLGWTPSSGDVKADGADNFFQKYLYMGAFPMCPFPGNDHSIRPDDWTDSLYLDYGGLMKQMNEREWVLEEKPVNVTSKDAKANIFKVRDRYVVPVVFAKNSEVTIEVGTLVRTKGTWSVTVIYPGIKQTLCLDNIDVITDEVPKLTLPIIRGCAMVILEKI